METRHLLSVQSKIDHLQRVEATLVEIISACSKEGVPECPLIESLFNG
jgi:MerR family mercuric resistance operon transcriptional regulator